jgi:hypothetical protein
MTTKKIAKDESKPDENVKHFPELSEEEKTEAEKEGVKAAMAQSAQTNFATQSATEAPDYVGDRWPDRHEIMRFAHIIDLGLDAFKKAIADDAESLIPEGKVAGLLELERSGKNRTEYVNALCKRLGVKSPLEVTSAGPGHTNDVTPVAVLAK